MGEAYSIADPYLFTLARWMEIDGLDPAAFPRVLDHRDRMRARPAVQRALRSEGLA
jgi:glutathione S-transferase